MRTARQDAIEATEQFAADTDDPKAALAAFRLVLAEAEQTDERGVRVLTEGLDLGEAMRLFGRAFSQVDILAHGLARLVERVMEAFDEDTWRDFLRDEAEDGWIAEDHTAERHEGVERVTGAPCQHPRCLAAEDYDSTPPTNAGCYDEPEPAEDEPPCVCGKPRGHWWTAEQRATDAEVRGVEA